MVDQPFQGAKQDFDRDGVAVIRGFLAGNDKQQMLDHLARFLDEVVPTLDRQDTFYEDKDDPQSLFRQENLHQHDAYFGEMLNGGACRALAELLLDGPVVPRFATILAKAPRIGKATPPHQDGYYWKVDPPAALTLWLAIDAASEANGCVRYIRGSHRRGMRPHGQSSVFGFSQHVTDYGNQDEQNELAIHVQGGDLIAHHCMTIHRADANRSDLLRRAIGLVYYAQRAKVDEQKYEASRRTAKSKWGEDGKL